MQQHRWIKVELVKRDLNGVEQRHREQDIEIALHHGHAQWVEALAAYAPTPPSADYLYQVGLYTSLNQFTRHALGWREVLALPLQQEKIIALYTLKDRRWYHHALRAIGVTWC